MEVEYLKRTLLVVSWNENKSLWIRTLEVKYLYKVYRVRISGMRGSRVEYLGGVIGIKGVDVSDSIIIDINK